MKKAKIIPPPEDGRRYIATITKNTGLSQRETLEEIMINLATYLGVKNVHRILSAHGSEFYSPQSPISISYQSASNTILEMSRRLLASDEPRFLDWDHRPAVLFSTARGEALALLEPGGSWIPVDALDVAESGRALGSAKALQTAFASTFGAFDLPASFAEAGRPAKRMPVWQRP